MCKYCEPENYLRLPERFEDNKPTGRIFDTCIDKIEIGWAITLPHNFDIPILYCPYCGRKLEE